ncbi:hypothetical protein CALVIDRAFT_127330 [Calocera viscosa TUFC12733]|uniref:Uncharacterized protein n=1 Tax=Calocera viscosa (strain TUFC12733) TaxID=1330018 RepID=A0A167RS24_CALVF|nr:hypothetical protein CALVIDRAFT_127330 [Calocera viscosa TUFC12733]
MRDSSLVSRGGRLFGRDRRCGKGPQRAEGMHRAGHRHCQKAEGYGLLTDFHPTRPALLVFACQTRDSISMGIQTPHTTRRQKADRQPGFTRTRAIDIISIHPARPTLPQQGKGQGISSIARHPCLPRHSLGPLPSTPASIPAYEWGRAGSATQHFRRPSGCSRSRTHARPRLVGEPGRHGSRSLLLSSSPRPLGMTRASSG